MAQVGPSRALSGVRNSKLASGLVGRHREFEVLDALLADVRARRSRVLVLRGEAGVGKTALMDYVAATASGFRVLKAAGVESEMELAFAGVHQLCAPILELRDNLPGPQRDALGTGLGLIAGPTPDRFLVGLAVLSLLSAAAEAQPLVCLVDDVQWLDRASAQIIAFVARRLLAESVALILAVREPSDLPELAGLPERTIGGLSTRDARVLLDRASPGRLDERVCDRIVAETRGNPLALVELPRGLTAAEMAGGFALPSARPLAGQIEQSFLRRILSLPAETQQLLLIAAAEPLGDRHLLLRAAGLAGIGAFAGVPAEEEGLIEFGTQVRFRHPLVRSAAYRAGSIAARQAAHRALADATDPDVDPDRRAWHRAHAAAEPDEAVAADLERSAERAESRGGVAASAAFLERATELTPDPGRRSVRALAAARAMLECGALEDADELIAAAETGPLDELHRAKVAWLRAQVVYARRRGSDAPPLLLDAAQRLAGLDGRLARDAYLEAIGAAIFAGRLGDEPDERGVAEAAAIAAVSAAAPPTYEAPPQPCDVFLDGIVTRYTAGYAAAAPRLKQALQGMREAVASGDQTILWQIMRWLRTACPVVCEPVAPDIWEFEMWQALASRVVSFARESGSLGVLPVALAYRAGVHVQAGEFAAAAVCLEESEAIAGASGKAPVTYPSLALAAWRGDEQNAMRLIAVAMRDAITRGEGRAIGHVGYATAVLYNGLGRYQEALAAAQQGCEHDDLGFYGWTLVEMVEAAMRSDAPDIASRALKQLEERALAADTDWALGILARSKALLASGPATEDLYQEGIERLGNTGVAGQLARAHLLYGEWLRRENRRHDARAPLRVAHELLHAMGAAAFAERARRELLATGETARERNAATGCDLTPQELQVARLAADGRTNPDIGSELFISSRTVEYHLSKVYMKLGITSRRELRQSMRRIEQLAGVAPTAPRP